MPRRAGQSCIPSSIANGHSDSTAPPHMNFDTTPDCAQALDKADELAGFRQRFYIPEGKTRSGIIYLCGNSLGLQPKKTAELVQQELTDWAEQGVHGHVTAKRPWVSYHEQLTDNTAHVVGAKPLEVVNMNSLTVNLHLMMVSFYRPTNQRHRIVIEEGAFPSDRYAVLSQLKLHGFNKDSLIELAPRAGENHLRH